MLEIRAFEEKHFEDVRQVCVNTGPIEAGTDPVEREKLLAVYCDYYCEKEPQNVFVLEDENGSAQGYILCAESFRTYRKNFAPYMQKLRKYGIGSCILPLGEQIIYSFFGKKYPAHLHIDINREFTGNGNGTRLMGTLLEYLKSKGVKGVMLIVGSHNTAAIRFYKRNGFKILCSIGGGTAMAKEL